MYSKKDKGITLIALVITIVIMLILAAVAINIVVNFGLIDTTNTAALETRLAALEEDVLEWRGLVKIKQDAGRDDYLTPDQKILELFERKLLTEEEKTYLIAANPENKILEKGSKVGEKAISFVLSGDIFGAGGSVALTGDGTTENPYNYEALIGTASQDGEEITINGKKVNVGKYVAYTSTGTEYEKTIMDANSGNTDNFGYGVIAAGNLKPETLQWRIYDVKDGKVRIVAWNGTEIGTSNTANGKMKLGGSTADNGAKGYNNAVKLLNDACSTMYSATNATAKNLSYEDIADKIGMPQPDVKSTSGLTGWPNGANQVPTGTLTTSSQSTFVADPQRKTATGDLQNTYTDISWSAVNAGTYKTLLTPTTEYWLSSVCMSSNSGNVGFRVRYVHSGGVPADYLYYVAGSPFGTVDWDFYTRRLVPIVTLGSHD